MFMFSPFFLTTLTQNTNPIQYIIIYTKTKQKLKSSTPPKKKQPMHLHGHEYYLLNEGNGRWDGETVINPSNPLRRDTHSLRPNGYMVLQYDADNPGVWPFHCHVAWHLSTVCMLCCWLGRGRFCFFLPFSRFLYVRGEKRRNGKEADEDDDDLGAFDYIYGTAGGDSEGEH